MSERLARWSPVAAVVGLWIGYAFLREGPTADYGFRTSMCLVGVVLILARACHSSLLLTATHARPSHFLSPLGRGQVH